MLDMELTPWCMIELIGLKNLFKGDEKS